MISIVIPLYNNESTILRLYDSIKNQEYQNFEVIFVDDGSTDSTFSMIKNLSKSKKNYFVLRQENKGAYEARKVGIKKARGEYICFIDGDDWVSANYLKLLYDNLMKNDADLSMIGNYLVFNKKRQILPPLGKKIEKIVDKNELSFEWITGSNLKGFLPGKLIKSEKLKETLNENFHSNYMEDEALLTCLIPNLKRVAYTNEPCYYYVQNESSITHASISKKMFIGFFEAMEMLKKIISSDKDQYAWELRYVGEFRNITSKIKKDSLGDYTEEIIRACEEMSKFNKREVLNKLRFIDRIIFKRECTGDIPLFFLAIRKALVNFKYYVLCIVK